MSFELSDLDERVSDALTQYARPADPENCTEADLASLLGRNWRDMIVVLEQAASLTREQAEKIADYPLGPNWELDMEEAEEAVPETEIRDDTDYAEAVTAATDHTWLKGGPFWEAHDAFDCALIAAMAGDRISEMTRRDLTRAWGTVFETDRDPEK